MAEMLDPHHGRLKPLQHPPTRNRDHRTAPAVAVTAAAVGVTEDLADTHTTTEAAAHAAEAAAPAAVGPMEDARAMPEYLETRTAWPLVWVRLLGGGD